MFDAISLEGWRQFEKIVIAFHPRLTILTGGNGSGKTTILDILSFHFGWPGRFVGTPIKDSSGKLRFIAALKKFFVKSTEKESNYQVFGRISYNNMEVSDISTRNQVGSTYQLHIPNKQPIRGFHIPSHRARYSYQNVDSISTSAISKQIAYNSYKAVKIGRSSGNVDRRQESYYLKQALISLATFGYGNEIVNRDENLIKIFEGFQKILKQVLPKSLGFEGFIIRMPEVLLKTKSGEFALDAVSGGISSIIDLAWQIHMYDESDEVPFTVTFDEPENHLHPEMQKTILPNFLKAFPKAQFIVATHSPFIIGSVPESQVYVLQYNKESKVESIVLDSLDKTGTANEILRSVLGLESTKPYWVDNVLEKIIEKYSKKGITKDNLSQLKNDLSEIGLDKYISSSLEGLLEKNSQE